MTTRATANQAPQAALLCDYCHQKPKFTNHQFCSKTCAGQAAALCNHCHKKAKFQNFDYCGKNCASLASANGSKPRTGNNSANANGGTTKINSTQQPATAGIGTIDPLQIAKMVVQHIPQVQQLLASVQGQGSSASSAGAGHHAPATQLGVGAQVIPPNQPSNNPFLNSVNPNNVATQIFSASSQGNNGTPSAPSSRGNRNTQQQLNISTKPVTDDLRCLIPGCKQPVHVDEEGLRVSDYCSMRHREEAVTSGLISPCIMCLVLPQSDKDYFCSRTCRDESLTKRYDDEEEWSPVTVGSQN